MSRDGLRVGGVASGAVAEIIPMARQDRAARKSGARTNLYDDIIGKIIVELEEGRLPWVQPWGTAAAKAPLAMPRNAATARQYSGINVLILWGAVIQHSYPTQAWLTFRQALALVPRDRRASSAGTADRHSTTCRILPADRARAHRSGQSRKRHQEQGGGWRVCARSGRGQIG